MKSFDSPFAASRVFYSYNEYFWEDTDEGTVNMEDDSCVFASGKENLFEMFPVSTEGPSEEFDSHDSPVICSYKSPSLHREYENDGDFDVFSAKAKTSLSFFKRLRETDEEKNRAADSRTSESQYEKT